MPVTAQELRQKRVALANQAREIMERPEKEKRSAMNALEKEQWNTCHNEIDQLAQQVAALEKQEKLETELRAAQPNGQFQMKTMNPDSGEGLPDAPGHQADLRTKAFRFFLQNGPVDMPPEYRKAIQKRAIGEGTISGYGVSEGFQIQIFQSLKDWNSVRQAPITYLKTEQGNNYPMMVDDDTSNTGELLAENTQTAGNADASFTQITLGAYMFSSKAMLYSEQALQDIENLEKSILTNAGARIGRSQGAYFTTGTGSGQPQGIVTAAIAAIGSNANLKVTGATGETASWIYDDVISLEHTIDPAYRRLKGANGMPLCGFMFNDSTLRKTKLIKDNYGRPLWMASLKDSTPDTIDGYPYYINQFMANMGVTGSGSTAVGNYPAAFGYFPAYAVRDVNDVRMLRLVERYADYLQVGFIAFLRTDAKMLQTNAFGLFENATS